MSLLSASSARPSPDVAVREILPFCGRDVLLLCVAEGPNFIELQTAAGQIAQRLVLVLAACLAYVYQQLHDRDD
jgi:hypothetical protein